MWAVWIALLLWTAPTQGVTTNCVIPAVERFQNTSLTCTFSGDISTLKQDFKVLFHKYNTPEFIDLILDCFWMFDKPECTVHKCCEYDYHANETLTLRVLNVTETLVGRYACIVLPAAEDSYNFCNFTLTASSPENTDLDPGPIIGSVCAIVVLIAVIIVVIVIVQKRRVRRKSVTKPYESTTPPRSESEKSSSKTNSYSEAGELDPTVRIDEGADDTVTYTIPGAPGAHPRSTRSTAQRSKRGPPQAVPTEQAAREEQPEYIEIENETRHNGEDGYLVPTSQYASLSTTRKSEEGHEYEKFGPKPTGSSSTVEYSGLIKSTKREKHLYDVLEKKETKQTGETGKQDPSRAAVVKKGSGKTSSSVKS